MKMCNLGSGVLLVLAAIVLSAQQPSAATPQTQLNPLLGGAQPAATAPGSTAFPGATDQPAPSAHAASAPAATSDTPPEDAPGPHLRQNPIDLLRAFEPDANEEYRLGKGDDLQVDFLGRPELQLKIIIGPDGRITLPVAGDVVLDGLTRSEAARAIEKQMSVYYTSIAAQVTVVHYTSNRIMVLGAVDHPGSISFDNTPTLLEVLTRGGVTTGMDASGKLRPMPSQCAIYRGQNQVAWVQLKDLLSTGNGMANLRLRRDDVVYIPSAADRFVSVLGAINKPGPVVVGNATPLISVLTEAGGLSEKAGSNQKIYIADPATGKTREVHFRDLLDPVKTREYNVHPGEIIYVSESRFFRATFFFQRLSPVFSIASYIDWMREMQ